MTDASDHQKFIDALRLAREQESCMESQIFQGIDVSFADAALLEFRRITFRSCRFSECDFTKSDFYLCRFEGCRLSECIFSGAVWNQTEVIRVKGDGCRFDQNINWRHMFTPF